MSIVDEKVFTQNQICAMFTMYFRKRNATAKEGHIMGYRFRKSVKAGPFRVNLSKSGVGYSVGGKGFRFTKKAGGGTRTTTSIPGTGVSFVHDSGGSKSSAPEVHNHAETNAILPPADGEAKPTVNPLASDAKEALLAWFLGIFGAHKFYRKKYFMGILYLLTFGLLSAGAFADGIWLTYAFCAKADGKPIKKQVKVIAWAVGILIPTLLIGGWLLTKPQPQQPVPVVAETVETTVATEPETVPTTVQTEPETTEPETAAATMAPVAHPAAYTTTYVLNTSSGKFHLPGCSSIKKMDESNKGTFTGTREQAIASGYEPCGNCNP